MIGREREDLIRRLDERSPSIRGWDNGVAAAVQPRFSLDVGNGEAVVGICRAMDAIPLALEWAAVRLHSLAPGQILLRLDSRFQLLPPPCRRCAAAPDPAGRAGSGVTAADRARAEHARRVSVFAGGI
jgi:predicted ATPase